MEIKRILLEYYDIGVHKDTYVYTIDNQELREGEDFDYGDIEKILQQKGLDVSVLAPKDFPYDCSIMDSFNGSMEMDRKINQLKQMGIALEFDNLIETKWIENNYVEQNDETE